MKDTGARARRLKAFYGKLKKSARNATPREPGPIIEELLFAILARETTDERAGTALQALRRNMVDLNELRVTTPREIVLCVGEDLAEATAKAAEIRDVLGDIVKRQNRLDLSMLKDRGLREAREYLETLRGVSAFAAAWVFARCLGGHAIAVDHNMARVLKEEEVVEAHAELTEVQAFLERHIPASEGQRFQALLREYALARRGPPRKGPRLASRSTARRKVAGAPGTAETKAGRTGSRARAKPAGGARAGRTAKARRRAT